MKIDEYGTVAVTQQQIVTKLRENADFEISGLCIEDGEQYLKACAETFLDMPTIQLWGHQKYEFDAASHHRKLQSTWRMPSKYANLDIEEWLINQCNTSEERERINSELELYRNFGLIDLLRYLKYLRDLATEHNIVWGVGRGSSCCSYCLYLMGIHRVDALHYNLDINEFLR